MSVGLTNVYANVIWFEPKYVVTKSESINLGYDMSEGENVVCWCTTSEGKGFWFSVTLEEYTEEIDEINNNLTPNKKFFNPPLRVIGWITTFDDIADNAPDGLGKTLILSGSVSSAN